MFIIAATNRPDLVDPALLRPGRLDKLVYLGISESSEEKLRVFSALTRKLPLGPDVDATAIVRALPRGTTGADMYALCCEAVLAAIRRTVATLDAGAAGDGRAVVSGTLLAETLSSTPTAGQTAPAVVVGPADFAAALARFAPSVARAELARYEELRRTMADQR